MKNNLLEDQLNSITRSPRPVRASKGVGNEYYNVMKRILNEIDADVKAQVLPLLKAYESNYVRDAWSDDIASVLTRLKYKYDQPQYAEAVAEQFVRSADDVNLTRFINTMKPLGINIFNSDPRIVDYLESSITMNSSLIKSLTANNIDRVEKLVMANVQAGTRPESIAKLMQIEFKKSKSQAKLIARDQSAKLAGQLSEKRQRSVGFEYFRWVDSGDSRVRDRHDDIADKITKYGKGVYRWDDLPFSQSGERIAPGQDFQCRCVAVPVSNKAVEKFMKSNV